MMQRRFSIRLKVRPSAAALMLAWVAAPAPVTAATDRAAGGSEPTALRVCADPNNLPFSNRAGEGFENRLAQLLAVALGTRVETTWWAQRRGFVRNTLNAGLCDVVMGVPEDYGQALTSQPYYRSSYVFVYRSDRDYALHSIDDPQLATLKIGVHAIGNDNPPPALALARRGIVDNVVGYSIYGDYRDANPPARLIDAVAAGDVDVAIAWGPLAGFFAARASTPLTVVPIAEGAVGALPFRFSIALGMRRGDSGLRDRLDAVLAQQRPAIDALLSSYGVPRLPAATALTGRAN